MILAGRLAAFALLLTALLALVAVASDGPAGGASRGSGAGVPDAVANYAFAVFVVAGALSVPAFFYVYAAHAVASGRKRPRLRYAPFVVLGAAAAAVFVFDHWQESFDAVFDRLRFAFGRPEGGRERGDATEPPPLDWVPFAVVSSVVLTAGGVVGARRALRRARGARGPALAERLTAAVDATLGELRDERDARRAIILAYARMEAALDCCGVPRREHEAPLEYLARVLLELEVTAEPVAVLTDLFEHAKFSHHEIDDGMKERAIAALVAIRVELEDSAG